jgi:hypothetical protein
MGFYKYIPGQTEPEYIFTERYSELVSGAYGSVTGRAAGVNTSAIPFETFETMFARINEFGDSFKIIFFSSCGEIRDTNPSSTERIQEILGMQHASVDKWNHSLRVNYNEDRKALKALKFNQANAEKLGLKLTEHVPRKLKHFSLPQVPELHLALRGANKKGGTRRRVKKSKRTRRNTMRNIKYRT